MVHQGDNISGRGDGDDEQIAIDLAQVHPRVDSMLFLVSSYQGHSLEFVRNAYCRLVDEDDVELARFTLTEGVPRTGFMLAKMFRDGRRVEATGHRPGHRRQRADRVAGRAAALRLTDVSRGRGS